MSQSVITGQVRDSVGSEIPYANIILKEKTTGETFKAVSTDDFGYYKLSFNNKGLFIIIFSSLGYSSFSFEIDTTQEISIMRDIVLKPNDIELNEVIVTKESPITIKRDTIIFDVKAFIKGNERVVEDLLKNIPGINISADGSIKVGNKEIEKIMIDGDDFFEKGYRLVSKNMPVNPIEKVELYQNYSNNKHLKDIEKSNKVALNLKLKDDGNREWFGNFRVGYGLFSENRYEFRTNLMNFGKRAKYYFLGNLNNIADDPTGDVNSLIRPLNLDEDSYSVNEARAATFMEMDVYVPQLKNKRVNFNNAEMVSSNGIFTVSPSIKVKALMFFNSDENKFYKNSYQRFFTNNTYFENNENLLFNKNLTTAYGKIDVIYDISKNKTFEYTSRLNFQDEHGISKLLFNEESLNEDSRTTNNIIDQKVVFTNKIDNQKVLILSGRYMNDLQPQNYNLNQFIYQELFNVDGDAIRQNINNRMQFYGVEISYLDRKKNGSLIEIKGGNKYRNDILSTKFKILDDNTVLEPNGYQNNLKYQINDLYTDIKYSFNFNKFGFRVQAEAHQFLGLIKTQTFEKKQSPFFINPKADIEFIVSPKNKLNASYSFAKTNAEVSDVYDSYIHTAFRNFTKGTGAINQTASSTATLNYNHGSWSDKFFANVFLMFVGNHDFFSTNAYVFQNFVQSEAVLFKGRKLLTFTSNFEKYIKLLSSNFKLQIGGSQSEYKNRVNDELRNVDNLNFNYGFELRSGFSRIFNYHIGSKWNYNQISTTVTNSYTDNMSFADLSFVFDKIIDVQVQAERYYFGNSQKYNTYYFMDFEARYVLKPNKLTFSLSVNNLFNTETFINYNISDISISTTEYRLQPRYLLLKMEYSF